MTEKYSKKGTIFCIIFTLFYGVSPKNINGATNGNVTLQPLVEGEIEDILWKHEGNKLVEWDKQTHTIIEYLKFKGRTKLDVKTGDVTLVNLAKGDTGLYDAEIVIRGRLMIIQHTLKVIDPVTETKITCQSNATMTTLHCEAEGDFLSYSWSGPGLQTAEMKGQTGPQISEEKDKDSVYTCVVNNPVSKNSVTYITSECFTPGYLQVIIGVVCAVVGVGTAAGLGYYCYLTAQKNKSKCEARGKE